MRLLTLLVLLAAIVAAVGFYQGWFHVSSTNEADTSAVTVTVDKTKLQHDREIAEEKVEAVGQEVKSKVAPAVTQPATNP